MDGAKTESSADKLTPLPRELLAAFFEHERGCFLTGGAALAAALAKDGGCTPAALAWVLSQITVADGAALPGGVTGRELRGFRDDLVKRLRRAAAPDR
jgi:hypothetical protein